MNSLLTLRPLFSAISKILWSASSRRKSSTSNRSYTNEKLFADYEATVNQGLEHVAQSEVMDKFGVTAQTAMGRVLFRTDESIDNILKLRSINNLFLTIFDKTLTDEEMPVDEKSLDKLLIDIGEQCDWRTGLEKWKEMSKFDCETNLLLTNDENLRGKQPKFRVSSKRMGCDHKFASPDLCRVFGGIVNDKFGWPVKLKDSDLDIYCNANENRFYVNLTLSPTCLAYRNIKVTGLTTLKAAICYAMLRKAQIQPGDIVLDPMAGSGAIPIECCDTWLDGENSAFSLGGDKQRKPLNVYNTNITSFMEKERKPPHDMLRLNAKRMPFCDESIDVIVCDVPFGHRHGSTTYNERLYPALLRDMARVTRRGTGRAVLLTHDYKNMVEAYKQTRDLWVEKSDDFLRVGNLDCFIYLYARTDLPYDELEIR